MGVIRANPRPTLGLAAVSIGTIAGLGVLARLPLLSGERVAPDADRDIRQVVVTLGVYPASTMLVTLIWMLASVGVTAIGSIVAHRYATDRTTSLRRAWVDARPRLAAAVGLGVLDVVVILTPIVFAAAAAIGLAVRAGPDVARFTTTVLFTLAGLTVLAVLPTLVIAGPMLVIEKLRPVDALWRAAALQRTGYWRLWRRVICTYLVVTVVSTLVGLPFSLAANATRPADGDVAAQSLASLLFATSGWVLGQIAVLPFLIVANTLLYADQKARTETAEPVGA
ncbi:hypothetical protein [Tsukamurella pseudospumae]|uniref:Glycerophosphoryl diester phosphodiesterase membrane domain-containing protein n=1 Tax=Tsukamurella pseudospumae TaxID=239498 RepID=A0A137ZMV7_9ACTN|nr:hypothetical protein [Tsukamurella pseudospumae]KXO99517.1 hypothetical protein AXK61_16930 [Tsukamurella pseudospumae]